jgi:hypothetical protein
MPDARINLDRFRLTLLMGSQQFHWHHGGKFENILEEYSSLTHWLGDSNFSAQFTVKNVDCFSDIFH